MAAVTSVVTLSILCCARNLSHAETVPTHSASCSHPAHSQVGTILRRISLVCRCACLIPWGCFVVASRFAFTGGQQGRRCYCWSMLHADLTLLLHTHQVADGACFLFTAYTCCMQVLPLLLRTCAAGATAYPYNAWDCPGSCRLASQRDCLSTFAFHVNVYALITPPPRSIVSFFRPPLQRSPSVVTLVSTYCSSPVGGDRQEFRESPFVRPRGPACHLPFCSICPRCGVRPVLGVRAL